MPFHFCQPLIHLELLIFIQLSSFGLKLITMIKMKRFGLKLITIITKDSFGLKPITIISKKMFPDQASDSFDTSVPFFATCFSLLMRL
jgi:hypothetical protein